MVKTVGLVERGSLTVRGVTPWRWPRSLSTTAPGGGESISTVTLVAAAVVATAGAAGWLPHSARPTLRNGITAKTTSARAHDEATTAIHPAKRRARRASGDGGGCGMSAGGEEITTVGLSAISAS